jgi:hypothetical protein
MSQGQSLDERNQSCSWKVGNPEEIQESEQVALFPPPWHSNTPLASKAHLGGASFLPKIILDGT